MQTTIELTGLSAVLARIRAAGSAETARVAIEAGGRGVSNLAIQNFRNKNAASTPRPGWPKSNFYEEAAESVNTTAYGDHAIVRVYREGVALRLKGGTVRPKAGRMLAIPIDPKVAGVWPSEYSAANRIFRITRKSDGQSWLAEKSKVSKEPRWLWLLKAETTHQPDPSVLPSHDALNEAATEAAKAAIDL